MGTLGQRLEAGRYNTAYRQGEVAAIDRQPITSNPFDEASAEYIAWVDGWIDGNGYIKRVTA